MVLIVDSNSEIDAHVRSHLRYLIWHFFGSRAVTNLIFSSSHVRSQVTVSYKYHGLEEYGSALSAALLD